MSRYLQLNFEDFGLNQDITKTIQPFSPFCICCLDREGPMFDLGKCEHSDFIDAFAKPQLNQFNQLVCLQCHTMLKKIKCFQKQIIESYSILLSGTFTNATLNSKRLNSLIIQKVVVDLHLPPDIIPEDGIIDKDPNNSIGDFNNEIQNSSLEENFNEISDVSNEEENLIQEQHRLNKNIKTALEILERNNQSFVTLGSQLQFLNGEHLSFLEPSLLSKEILTDIPLVPAKNLSTDLDHALLNNSKALDIEIDEPDKMFYDSLDLSPGLMGKDTTSEIMDIAMENPHVEIIRNEIESKTKTIKSVEKPKKEKKAQKNMLPLQIRRVKLSQDELNRERVLQAQSDAYLKFKFRCETCIVGFNYRENLDDHSKRKHGPKGEDSVICDICSQLIPNVGSVTEHNYRHYTRYECMRCSRRYPTHDEAIMHCAKNKCANCDSANRSLKMKQTSAQLRRAKLKTKQTKN